MKKIGAIFLASLLISACAPKSILITRSRLMMGHVPVNVTLKMPPSLQEGAWTATEKAYETAQNLEAKISEWQPGSEVSCLNRRAGKGDCALSKETFELLRTSVEISEKTAGAFDIRFNSLSEKGREGPILLNPESQGRLSHPDTRIGVGGIGKGFIVDAMIERLRSLGFSQALVDAGGDVKASGGPWKVAIQKPGGRPGAITRAFEVTDQAVSTSGDYEQPGHILDPRSGEKVQRPSSVTVITESHTTADALATAFYVMGEEESARVLGRFEGVKMIWTDPQGNTREYPSGTKKE